MTQRHIEVKSVRHLQTYTSLALGQKKFKNPIMTCFCFEITFHLDFAMGCRHNHLKPSNLFNYCTSYFSMMSDCLTLQAFNYKKCSFMVTSSYISSISKYCLRK